MEIIVVFLIFLLFYWNIFVILRKKYRIMEYIFSKKKLVVLKHLADREQHEEAPAGLTDAQVRVALSELKACDMVKVNVTRWVKWFLRRLNQKDLLLWMIGKV